jgi:phage repressor protein C with HTH and peptisase S24 domain
MEKKELLNKAIKENRIIPVTVYGDGMEPEYFNGDIILVDTKYKNPSGGGEFCINGIGTNVVRADCNGKGIQIIMTNKHHNDYAMDYNQFASNVIGRIVGHIQSCLITEITSNPTITQKAIA